MSASGDEMFVLCSVDSDGCTYHAEHPLAVFVDRDIADLVAEEMNKLSDVQRTRRGIPRKTRHSGEIFVVRPFAFFQNAEDAVRDVARKILDAHFPSSPRGS